MGFTASHVMELSSNSSSPLIDSLLPSKPTFPIYHFHRDSIFPSVSDSIISLISPLAAYWGVSLFFVLLDHLQLPAVEKYRIHEPEEVTKRNKVTPREVVKAVLVQQVLQTVLGVLYLEETVEGKIAGTDYREEMRPYAVAVAKAATAVLAPQGAGWLLTCYGRQLTEWLYWWGVPIVQFFFACFLMDTWQYFWHRLFHMNKFLYRHFHSIHHRLYVPYAFGALYNHPLEGFVLDSLGAVISHWGSGMTIRQAILLFGVSTAKTVDDHCGLALPWDPLQVFFGNNADYHDIHHQQFGIKRNFSQPYFIHWDVLLNTRMTREEAAQRRFKHTDSQDPEMKKLGGLKGVKERERTQGKHVKEE